ncbi:MAG: transglutaminase N-terminal domain-containing protein [Propioniciclava sp.]
MSQVYRIVHETTYRYDAAVEDSYGLAYIRPRDLPGQRCLAHEFSIEPDPSDSYPVSDIQGNGSVYFHVTTPHDRLRIAGVSVVEVSDVVHDEVALAQPWEGLRPAGATDARAWAAVEFTLASPLIEIHQDVVDYAAPSFVAGRPVGEVVDDLSHRIHADFSYDPQVTTVTSTVPDVLARRGGVCQDFAHLLIACLRSHGLAGRYVSGYLATVPPAGGARLVGADASHAWAACWLGGERWLAVDPTNDKRCDDAHATVAWGRDYGDVPPVRGVIFTDATGSSLEVSVDMRPFTEVADLPTSG